MSTSRKLVNHWNGQIYFSEMFGAEKFWTEFSIIFWLFVSSWIVDQSKKNCSKYFIIFKIYEQYTI